MQSIRNFLGLKKKDTHNKTVAELQETQLMLTKQHDFLQDQVQEQNRLAKSYGLRKKTEAKRALLKRNAIQKKLDQVSGMLVNVENQLEALGSVNLNKDVIQALSDGAVALKSANETIDIAKVNDMMDTIGEQQDIAQEIVDAISQPVPELDVDDEELTKELEAIEQEELDKALLTVPMKSKAKVEEDSDSGAEDDNENCGPSSSGKPHVKPISTKLAANFKSTEEEAEEEEMEQLRAWSSA